MTAPTLRIDKLNLEFQTTRRKVQVLHDVCLHINNGEKVALVGESGSGKSVTARIILGLLHSLASSRISGVVEFEGKDLETMSARQRHRLRGNRITMIFQDPTSALNPVFTIATQFHEVLARGTPGLKAAQARQRASEALARVSILEAERVLDSYSFQLSGGMNQRVMIAMALANHPSLLIADEPGTALDVTVQAQTLQLMANLVEQENTSVLFISHNLGVVREFADRVYVIYRGRIVEQARTADLFADPRHPYTQALLQSVPRITGEGIPDIPEDSDRFLEPRIVHDGAGEPVGGP